MAEERAFDPNRVAYFEGEGWRAYYDRRWFRLLQLVVSLSHEQFRIPYPQALLAAYYVTRASVAWVPLDHDEAKVLRFYEKFYGLARRYSGLEFDPVLVAQLELRYNDDHRRLVGQPDESALLQTLVELHSALFLLPAEAVRESAQWRLEALNTVDLITSKQSSDVEADWRRIDDQLKRCYGSLLAALQSSARRE